MLVISLACISQMVWAQVKEDRILIVLDGSASMLQSWDEGQTACEAAAEFISKLAGDMHVHNSNVGFGLRLYGHQYHREQQICNDSRKEVSFSKDNDAQLYLRLQDIRPKGQGSLAYALEQASTLDITDTQYYRYSILVIRDTSTKCSHDGCVSLKEIQKRFPFYRTYEVVFYKGSNANRNNCYDQNFSIGNEQEAANTVVTILSDFPKATKQYNFPVTETKKNQEELYFKPARQKNTLADTIVVEVNTQKPDTSSAVIISKKSRITTDSMPIEAYGYINLLYTSARCNFVLYRIRDNAMQRINEAILPGKRTKLAAGNYHLVYSNGNNTDTLRFFIKKRMITDVRMP